MYEDDKKKPAQKDQAPKLDMSLSWILSLAYDRSGNKAIRNIRTIENFDKSIKQVSSQAVAKYDSSMKRSSSAAKKDEKPSEKTEQVEAEKPAHEMENVIYVFECKRWLAKDMEDKKIERVLKPSNMLKAK
jgi:hypothetical protein